MYVEGDVPFNGKGETFYLLVEPSAYKQQKSPNSRKRLNLQVSVDLV